MVVVNRVIAEVVLRSRTLWRRVNEIIHEFQMGFVKVLLKKKAISEKTNVVFTKALQALPRR